MGIGNKAGKIWGARPLSLKQMVFWNFIGFKWKKAAFALNTSILSNGMGFYVEAGIMLVRVWQKDYDLVDETILHPGDYTKVKPGLYHQFECLESGVAYELYWAELNPNDIKRETVGHK